MKISVKFKQIVSLLLVLMMLITSLTRVDAASFSASASASTVSPNATFKVTIQASGCVGRVNISATNGTITSENSIWIENGSATVTVKAGNSGTTIVTVAPQTGFSDLDGNKYSPGTKTVSVTVKTPTPPPSTPTVTKSSDNKLSSLTVSEGTLSPTFKNDVLEYNVDVAATVSKITLNAKANHAKAKVSGTGEKTLNVGKNTFEIKCTAENGSVKTYKVHVNVDETPLIYTTYKEQRLGVVRNTTGLGIPNTFEETTIILDGQTVQAYQSNQFNKTIVYLQSETGEKDFYIYEEGNGIVSVFKPVSICGLNVYIYDIAESDIERENMIYQYIDIQGHQIKGWVFTNPAYANYALIKVMNEFGNEVMYSYEKTENTLQLYTEYVEEVDQPVEEPEEFPLEYIFIGTTAFFALTTLIMFIVHVRFKKKSIAAIKEYYQRRNQE